MHQYTITKKQSIRNTGKMWILLLKKGYTAVHTLNSTESYTLKMNFMWIKFLFVWFLVVGDAKGTEKNSAHLLFHSLSAAVRRNPRARNNSGLRWGWQEPNYLGPASRPQQSTLAGSWNKEPVQIWNPSTLKWELGIVTILPHSHPANYMSITLSALCMRHSKWTISRKHSFINMIFLTSKKTNKNKNNLKNFLDTDWNKILKYTTILNR